MKILNVSLDSFDDLNSIESLLANLEKSKFKFESWVISYAELFQKYGKMRRFDKITDTKVLYKDIVSAYLTGREKLVEYDLGLFKLMDEKYGNRPTIIINDYNARVKEVEAFDIKKFKGNDRDYMKYYLDSLSIGRKASFNFQLKSFDGTELVDVIRYAHLQVLRVVHKLEDFFSNKIDSERFNKIHFLLSKAYYLVDVDESKTTVALSLLDDEIDDDLSGMAIDETELNESIMKKMSGASDLKLEPILEAALEEMDAEAVDYERNILSARFMSIVLQTWKEESIDILIEEMKGMNIEELYALLDSFDNVNTLEKVPKLLQNKTYEILMANIEYVDKAEASDALEEIYDFVYGNVDNQSENLGNESEFWRLLIGILRDAYKDFRSIVEALKLDKLTGASTDYKTLLTNVKNADLTVEHFKELQSITNVILNLNAVLVNESNMKVLIDYVKKTEVKEVSEGNLKAIEIFGKNVRVEDVLSMIKDRVPKCYEVRFIGMDVLHVDTTLDKTLYHSKNIFVMANAVKVHGKCEWNVSGDDKNHITKPKAGQLGDGRGEDGDDGVAGDTAGSVVVACDKIENPETWTIVANGGKAAKGQEGGDGKNGRDGETFTPNEVDKTAPGIKRITIEQGEKFGEMIFNEYRKKNYLWGGAMSSWEKKLQK